MIQGVFFVSPGLAAGAAGEGLGGVLVLAATGVLDASFVLSFAAWGAVWPVLGRDAALLGGFAALNVQAKLKTDSPSVSGTTTSLLSFALWRIDLISLSSPS